MCSMRCPCLPASEHPNGQLDLRSEFEKGPVPRRMSNFVPPAHPVSIRTLAVYELVDMLEKTSPIPSVPYPYHILPTPRLLDSS